MCCPSKTRPILIGEKDDEYSRCRPRLSGIPPHVALISQMARLQATIEEHTSNLIGRMKDELDKRGIGGETFQANAILQDARKLHEEMGKMMQQGGTVGGGGGIGKYNDTNRLPIPTVLVPNAPLTTGRGERTMYVWGSPQPIIHNVPEGFEIPRMNLQTLIVYWHCGSTQPLVPPLRYVKAYDFPKKQTWG